MKAKTINTLTICGAIVWTVSMSIWKAFDPDMGLSIGDICKVAFSLVGIVGGITGSIWLDKVMNTYKTVHVSRETSDEGNDE